MRATGHGRASLCPPRLLQRLPLVRVVRGGPPAAEEWVPLVPRLSTWRHEPLRPCSDSWGVGSFSPPTDLSWPLCRVSRARSVTLIHADIPHPSIPFSSGSVATALCKTLRGATARCALRVTPCLLKSGGHAFTSALCPSPGICAVWRLMLTVPSRWPCGHHSDCVYTGPRWCSEYLPFLFSPRHELPPLKGNTCRGHSSGDLCTTLL